jgi:hypothetical protein
VTQSTCNNSYKGTFYSTQSSCQANNSGYCLYSGSCSSSTQSSCSSNGGTFYTTESTCKASNSGYCLYSGNCYSMTQYVCSSYGGTFYTSFSNCDAIIRNGNWCVLSNAYERACIDIGRLSSIGYTCSSFASSASRQPTTGTTQSSCPSGYTIL